jgi:hypothetical protein
VIWASFFSFQLQMKLMGIFLQHKERQFFSCGALFKE